MALENLLPLEGANYATWAATSSTQADVTGTETAAGSVSGTGKALEFATTQTSGTMWAQAACSVAPETVLALSVSYKVDGTESVVPFTVLFYNYDGGTLELTVTPIAGANASTSYKQFNATVAVPVGCTYAVFKYALMTVGANTDTLAVSDPVVAA